MTASEATTIKAALSRISLAFVAGARINQLPYIPDWKADCDALTVNDGFSSVVGEVAPHTEFLANTSINGVLVVTVAALPSAPTTNDEAIVTDATVLTNATTVAGGGSNRVLVRYNGANWLIV